MALLSLVLDSPSSAHPLFLLHQEPSPSSLSTYCMPANGCVSLGWHSPCCCLFMWLVPTGTADSGQASPCQTLPWDLGDPLLGTLDTYHPSTRCYGRRVYSRCLHPVPGYYCWAPKQPIPCSTCTRAAAEEGSWHSKMVASNE